MTEIIINLKGLEVQNINYVQPNTKAQFSEENINTVTANLRKFLKMIADRNGDTTRSKRGIINMDLEKEKLYEFEFFTLTCECGKIATINTDKKGELWAECRVCGKEKLTKIQE